MTIWSAPISVLSDLIEEAREHMHQDSIFPLCNHHCRIWWNNQTGPRKLSFTGSESLEAQDCGVWIGCKSTRLGAPHLDEGDLGA